MRRLLRVMGIFEVSSTKRLKTNREVAKRNYCNRRLNVNQRILQGSIFFVIYRHHPASITARAAHACFRCLHRSQGSPPYY